MAKYKAKDSFKSAKNKHFGVHKINNLLQGGSIEITDFESLPESVKKHLVIVEEKIKKTKKVSKPDTKNKENK